MKIKAIKEVKEDKSQIDFLKALQDPVNSIAVLETFLQLASEYDINHKNDVIKEYLASSKHYDEIFKVMDGRKFKNHEVHIVLDCIRRIALRVSGDLEILFPLAGKLILKQAMSKSFKLIKFQLSIKNKSAHLKSAFGLLDCLVSQNAWINADILSRLDVNNLNFIQLVNRKDITDREDPKFCLLKFLVSVLKSKNLSAIKYFIDSKDLCKSIFLHLMGDQCESIVLFLEGLIYSVIENSQITKSVKMRFFSEFHLKLISRLYRWVGPIKWQDTKKSKKKPENTTEFDINNLTIEQEKVRESVHALLLKLTTTFKFGLIFNSEKSFGSRNPVLLHFLCTLPRPVYGDPMVRELVINCLSVCPDIIHDYLSHTSSSYGVRASPQFADAMNFLIEIYDSNLLVKKATDIHDTFLPSNIWNNLLIGIKANDYISYYNSMMVINHFQRILLLSLNDKEPNSMRSIMDVIKFFEIHFPDDFLPSLFNNQLFVECDLIIKNLILMKTKSIFENKNLLDVDDAIKMLIITIKVVSDHYKIENELFEKKLTDKIVNSNIKLISVKLINYLFEIARSDLNNNVDILRNAVLCVLEIMTEFGLSFNELLCDQEATILKLLKLNLFIRNGKDDDITERFVFLFNKLLSQVFDDDYFINLVFVRHIISAEENIILNPIFDLTNFKNFFPKFLLSAESDKQIGTFLDNLLVNLLYENKNINSFFENIYKSIKDFSIFPRFNKIYRKLNNLKIEKPKISGLNNIKTEHVFAIRLEHLFTEFDDKCKGDEHLDERVLNDLELRISGLSMEQCCNCIKLTSTFLMYFQEQNKIELCTRILVQLFQQIYSIYVIKSNQNPENWNLTKFQSKNYYVTLILASVEAIFMREKLIADFLYKNDLNKICFKKTFYITIFLINCFEVINSFTLFEELIAKKYFNNLIIKCEKKILKLQDFKFCKLQLIKQNDDTSHELLIFTIAKLCNFLSAESIIRFSEWLVNNQILKSHLSSVDNECKSTGNIVVNSILIYKQFLKIVSCDTNKKQNQINYRNSINCDNGINHNNHDTNDSICVDSKQLKSLNNNAVTIKKVFLEIVQNFNFLSDIINRNLTEEIIGLSVQIGFLFPDIYNEIQFENVEELLTKGTHLCRYFVETLIKFCSKLFLPMVKRWLIENINMSKDFNYTENIALISEAVNEDEDFVKEVQKNLWENIKNWNIDEFCKFSINVLLVLYKYVDNDEKEIFFIKFSQHNATCPNKESISIYVCIFLHLWSCKDVQLIEKKDKDSKLSTSLDNKIMGLSKKRKSNLDKTEISKSKKRKFNSLTEPLVAEIKLDAEFIECCIKGIIVVLNGLRAEDDQDESAKKSDEGRESDKEKMEENRVDVKGSKLLTYLYEAIVICFESCKEIKLTEIFYSDVWPSFIKIGLRKHLNRVEYLKILIFMNKRIFSTHPNTEPNPSQLFKMVVCHSQFLKLITNKDMEIVKELIVEFLFNLMELDVKGCCKVSCLPFLYAAYKASLTRSDLIILRILFLFEQNHDLSVYKPYLWGSRAMEAEASRRNIFANALHECNPNDIFDVIDADQMNRSIFKFPLLRITGEINQPYDKGVYDPAYLLPMFYHSLDPDSLPIDLQRFVEVGCLGYIIAALSSHDLMTRRLAIKCLEIIHAKLSEDGRIKGKDQIEYILLILRNSMTSPTQRLPSMITCFLASTIQLMLEPENHMYVPMNEFMLLKCDLDLFNVPEFYKLFFSSHSVKHSIEKGWILTNLINGTREKVDYWIILNKHLMKIILTFYSSPLCNPESKMKIIQWLDQLVSIQSVARDLVLKRGLLSWIGLISTNKALFENSKGGLVFQLLKSFAKLLQTLFFSLTTSHEKKSNLINIVKKVKPVLQTINLNSGSTQFMIKTFLLEINAECAQELDDLTIKNSDVDAHNNLEIPLTILAEYHTVAYKFLQAHRNNLDEETNTDLTKINSLCEEKIQIYLG